MAKGIEQKQHWLRSGLRPDRIRLASGIVLMVFLAGHLINHALGLISLNAMEAGRDIFLAIWRSVPGTTLLLGAIVLHILLVFLKLLRHRAYRRLAGRDILQITLGLAIPPFIILSCSAFGLRPRSRHCCKAWRWLLPGFTAVSGFIFGSG